MDSIVPVALRRVLVCTSDSDLHDEIGGALDQSGFHAVWARDAEQALSLLEERPAHAMVCDQDLSDHDGVALLQQIRRTRPELADMPIIVMSAFGEKSDIVAGKLAGADDYLSKPVDTDLLLASLEAQLRQAERVREATLARYDAAGGSPRLQALYALMDRLSFGVELFNAQGQPIFGNRAARGLPRTISETIRTWVARHAGRAAHHGGRPVRPRPGVLDFRMIPVGVSRNNSAQHLFVVTLALTQQDPVETVLAAATFPSGHGGLLGGRLVADAIGLTPTEARLAGLLAEGLRLEQIGEMMGIARPTVNYHLRNIYQKSGSSRQADVINLLRAVHLAEMPGGQGGEGPAA